MAKIMDEAMERENDYRRKREQEKQTVSEMIALYCRKKHGTAKGSLCNECAALKDYARTRIDRCPHMENKTFCSRCPTHCYKPAMREKIREVMRFAGPRMLLVHPAMAIKHVLSGRQKRETR